MSYITGETSLGYMSQGAIGKLHFFLEEECSIFFILKWKEYNMLHLSSKSL